MPKRLKTNTHSETSGAANCHNFFMELAIFGAFLSAPAPVIG